MGAQSLQRERLTRIILVLFGRDSKHFNHIIVTG